MAEVGLPLLAHREAAFGDADVGGPVPELALRVMRGRALRLVGDQQLEDHGARLLGALAGALHHHAVARRADAGRRQHALAFDLHHAGAAVAVGAVARFRLIAEMRDLRPVARGGLPDGLARLRLDVLPVEGEADDFLFRDRDHFSSSGKYLRIDVRGLGAAWPRPQIEASRMTCDSSSSSGTSQLFSRISFTAFSVPLRQGVHWPQDSSSKKRMRLRATAFMSSRSEDRKSTRLNSSH